MANYDHERRDQKTECDPVSQGAVEETRAFLGGHGGHDVGQRPERIGIGQFPQEGVVAVNKQVQLQRYVQLHQSHR